MSLTLRSEEARMQWGTTMDAAYAEKKDVVIERYGRPIVTIVNHAKYENMVKRLAELEMLLVYNKRKAEVQEDPTLLISQDEFNHIPNSVHKKS